MNWWKTLINKVYDSIPITKNFKLSEFHCEDGTRYPDEWVVDRLLPLCESLEIIRRELGNKSITITSGYRTPSYNKKVGGVAKSRHLTGMACDLKVEGVSARIVQTKIKELMREGKIPKGGLGCYKTFTHYDQDRNGKMVVWNG